MEILTTFNDVFLCIHAEENVLIDIYITVGKYKESVHDVLSEQCLAHCYNIAAQQESIERYERKQINYKREKI